MVFFPGSSAVEQATVNRLAGGSNPSWGAIQRIRELFIKTRVHDCPKSKMICPNKIEEKKIKKDVTKVLLNLLEKVL